MQRILFFLLFTAFLIVGCSDSSHHHDATGAKVELDNGQRWQANPETTDGIKRMQAILAAYNPTGSVEDKKALRQELEDTFQNIFKECTMKGEAHQQLHNYLLPMKKQFERIESEESKAAIQQLEKHLEHYETYFK